MYKLLLIAYAFQLLVPAFGAEIANNHVVAIADIEPWIKTKGKVCERGLVCDFYRDLNQYLDQPITFDITSLARSNMAFLSGEQPLGLFYANERLEELYFNAGKVIDVSVGVLAAKGAKAFDKEKSKICTRINNPNKLPGYHYVEVAKLKQCHLMLAKGRVKFVQITDVDIRYKQEHENFKLTGVRGFRVLQKVPVYFYINKSLRSFSNEFKSYLNAFKKVNLAKLAEKYSLKH